MLSAGRQRGGEAAFSGEQDLQRVTSRQPSTREADDGMADLAPACRATEAMRDVLLRLPGVAPAERNASMLSLAQLLITVNTTLKARFRHDPAYTMPPLATLAIAAELPRLPEALVKAGGVELLRGQKRYVAAILAATRMVHGALDRA
jgi:hypothetical protein